MVLLSHRRVRDHVLSYYTAHSIMCHPAWRQDHATRLIRNSQGPPAFYAGGECGCRRNSAAALGAMLPGSQVAPVPCHPLMAPADDKALVPEHVNGVVSPETLGCAQSLRCGGQCTLSKPCKREG